ncbi:MAG: hypothetical protein V4649_10070 [Bacteroidota bacterium]
MRNLFVIVLVLCAQAAAAQLSIPFGFLSDDKNKFLRENDSVKFYAATGDTSRIVSINEETSWYKLISKKDGTVVAEGSFWPDEERALQDGKAFTRYPSGTIKLSGYYLRGKPVGTWQSYYAGGQLKAVYNYGIINDDNGISTCYSGLYQEYYENGKLKVNGFYAAKMSEVADTVAVEDPVSGDTVTKVLKRSAYAAAKAGRWEYYNQEGEFTKKDEF